MVKQARGLGLAGLLTNILVVSLAGLLLSHHLEINKKIDDLTEEIGNEHNVAMTISEWLVADREESRQQLSTVNTIVNEKLKALEWRQNVKKIGEFIKMIWSLLAELLLGVHSIYLLTDVLLVFGLFSNMHFFLIPWILIACFVYSAYTIKILGGLFMIVYYYAPLEINCWCIAAAYIAVFAVHAHLLYKVWIQSLVIQVMTSAYRTIRKKKREARGHLTTNVIDGYGDKVFLINE